jgi:cysteine desulfurase
VILIEKMSIIRFDTAGGAYPITGELFWKTIQEMTNRSTNPNGNNPSARSAQEGYRHLVDFILKLFNTSSNDYQVIVTSGASECNNFVLRSTADHYNFRKKETPEVWTFALEHDTTRECIRLLSELGRIKSTEIPSGGKNTFGEVDYAFMQHKIKTKRPRLVSVMHVNNETGTINDLHRIRKILPKEVRLHSDLVQSFGKSPIDLKETPLDFVTISTNKVENGVVGIGFLLVHKRNMEALVPQISGHSYTNGQLRGGTPSTLLITAAHLAIQANFVDRKRKNKYIDSLRKYFVREAGKRFELLFLPHIDPTKRQNIQKPSMLFLTGPKNSFPHIALVSILIPEPHAKKFCNIKLKEFLEEKHDIYISISSICNTSSAKASVVITGLGISDYCIKRGVQRISFSEFNTTKEVDKLMKGYLNYISTISK